MWRTRIFLLVAGIVVITVVLASPVMLVVEERTVMTYDTIAPNSVATSMYEEIEDRVKTSFTERAGAPIVDRPKCWSGCTAMHVSPSAIDPSPQGLITFELILNFTWIELLLSRIKYPKRYCIVICYYWYSMTYVICVENLRIQQDGCPVVE